jgi:peptide/nickel transport system permease protein
MTNSSPASPANPAAGRDVRARRSIWENARRALAKAPISAWFGMIVILIYAISAIFAPWIAPYGEADIVGRAYQPSSEQFLLGTDQIGRDLFSRLIYGARNTIGIALVTTLISFCVGGTMGVLTALKRGWLDQGVSRVVDAFLAIPVLIFALMLLAVFGRNIANLILILALLDSTRVFRLARATALNVVVMDFVEAAKLRGEGLAWIVFREILPNILPPLITEFGLRFCFVFLTISALSFLGVGVQPPTADWGSMVAENKSLITYGNPTPLYPAGAIALLTVAVNFVVDWFLHKTSGLRDEH